LSEDCQVYIFDLYKHLGLPKILSGQTSFVTIAWAYFLRAVIREPFKIANQQLIKMVRQVQPDLVFIISIESVLPETIQQIKNESDAIIIGWFMDHVANFERGYFILADYDALFFVDPYIVRVLGTKLGNE